MHVRGRLGFAWFAALSVFAFAACVGKDATSTPFTAADAGGVDASLTPEPVETEDASVPLDAADASDTSVVIVDGPGMAGEECSFNRDCKAALRCECVEPDPCTCKAGTRGTGRNGIDACNDGNACASSLCVEGPTGTGSFCSDECKTSADCTGKLPLCSDIAFVGRICIRTP
jgi:hypothetical protein